MKSKLILPLVILVLLGIAGVFIWFDHSKPPESFIKEWWQPFAISQKLEIQSIQYGKSFVSDGTFTPKGMTTYPRRLYVQGGRKTSFDCLFYKDEYNEWRGTLLHETIPSSVLPGFKPNP